MIVPSCALHVTDWSAVPGTVAMNWTVLHAEVEAGEGVRLTEVDADVCPGGLDEEDAEELP